MPTDIGRGVGAERHSELRHGREGRRIARHHRDGRRRVAAPRHAGDRGSWPRTCDAGFCRHAVSALHQTLIIAAVSGRAAAIITAFIRFAVETF
jgi:hypothetical protein